VNFATGENHADLPQISDNQCAFCHIPQGELEFDVSIIGGHTIDRFSSALPGVVFELLKVDNAAPGEKPTLTFSIKDKAGNPLLASELNRVRPYLVGPTSDYSWYVREDALSAQASMDGVHVYTFDTPIPADAKGTYAIGIEGRRLVTLLPGTTKEMTGVRDLALNKVIYFSVDGSPVEPRRTVVALDIPNPGGPVRGCNSCHAFLALHGGNRNSPELCVVCHSPTEIDDSEEGPGHGINFALMIHKIHTGEELVADYTVEGTSFNEVRYPGDRRKCDHCHANDSQQLPLSNKLLQVKDPLGLLNPVGPTTSACTACHGEIYAASHALANTTTLGESCATCHKPEADASVNRVHAK
jgi:OmcA/MtrC family decaheme c-type cytochrome